MRWNSYMLVGSDTEYNRNKSHVITRSKSLCNIQRYFDHAAINRLCSRKPCLAVVDIALETQRVLTQFFVSLVA